MAVQVTDSDRRCPRCSKRMMVQLGQDDVIGTGLLVMVHECWHCTYTERESAWKRPRITDVAVSAAAERLRKQRMEGWVVPLLPPTEPFPKGEFDDPHA